MLRQKFLFLLGKQLRGRLLLHADHPRQRLYQSWDFSWLLVALIIVDGL